MGCVIDGYNKYVQVVPLKGKKGITITIAFQKILDKSNHKPNKIWVDKGSDFTIDQRNCGYKIMILKCIQHIKKDSKKNYEYMTSISKNVYIDKLDDKLINTATHILAQLE